MNNMAKENDDNGENAYQFERTLEEKRREFDEAHKLNRERLNFDREKAKTDAVLKRQQIKKQSIKATTKK
jgi:predicted nucleotidyltransferase